MNSNSKMLLQSREKLNWDLGQVTSTTMINAFAEKCGFIYKVCPKAIFIEMYESHWLENTPINKIFIRELNKDSWFLIHFCCWTISVEFTSSGNIANNFASEEWIGVKFLQRSKKRKNDCFNWDIFDAVNPFPAKGFPIDE